MAFRFTRAKVLSKKHWTPEDVGRLLIESYLTDIQRSRSTRATTRQPLISPEEYAELERGVRMSFYNAPDFDIYKALHALLVNQSTIQLDLLQKTFGQGFAHVGAILQEFRTAEEAETEESHHPLIMTDSQYKRTVSEATDILRSTPESFYGLVFGMLAMCYSQPNKAPKAVRDALELAQDTPARGKAIFKIYRTVNHFICYENGYHILPDGRSTENMSRGERSSALDKVNYISGLTNAAEKSFELFCRGPQAARNFVMQKTGKALDMTDEEILEKLETYGNDPDRLESLIDEALRTYIPTQWHTYTDEEFLKQFPDNFTAFDMLESIVWRAHDITEAKERRNFLKLFKGDFPELFSALKAYIEELVPETRELKPNQALKEFTTWGALADADVPGYLTQTTPKNEDIRDLAVLGEVKPKRCFFRFAKSCDIAILQLHTNPSSLYVNSDGDYVPEPTFRKTSILAFTDDDRESRLKRKNVEHWMKTIKNTMASVYAHDALMEALGKVFNLPEIGTVAKYNKSYFDGLISKYNKRLVYLFFFPNGTKDEVEEKRHILRDYFGYWDFDYLKPSQEAIDDLTETLSSLQSNELLAKLQNYDSLLQSLKGRLGK